MFGFGKKNIFLGVDVGVASIKIVEIRLNNNKPYLSNYAWAKRAIVISDESAQQINSFDGETVKCLKNVLKEGSFKSDSAHVAIPAFGGMVALIEFPDMNKDDLNQAIKFEAHKYIPASLEDTALSWEIVGRRESADSLVKKSDFLTGGNNNDEEKKTTEVAFSDAKVQVLLVAAPKKKVVSYEELIKNAGLTLESIEIESFSLVRSLVGNDPGNFLIIDIGGRVCNMILAEKGVIKVNRNIDAGGRDITKTIARSMGVDEVRAKSIKISKENLLGRDSSIHFPTFDVITSEARRVLEAYYKNEGKKNIDGIILSGGTAGMTGIAQYFSDVLGIKATIGNPFGRIEYDKSLEPILKESGTRFSVSVGLALKGMEEYIKK
jgi:type IV pilus assembly protein PilM